MVSLVGRVFFSCVSVFFSLALLKLLISPMSGLSAIFLKQSEKFRFQSAARDSHSRCCSKRLKGTVKIILFKEN